MPPVHRKNNPFISLGISYLLIKQIFSYFFRGYEKVVLDGMYGNLFGFFFFNVFSFDLFFSCKF